MRLHRSVSVTPTMIIALLALVFAVGGTSYAVSRLPAKSVGSRELKNQAVTSAKLATGAITADKIKAGAVTSERLAAGAVTAAQIARGAVSGDKLAAGAVSADKIAADAVTGAQVDEATLGEVPSAGIAGLTRVSRPATVPGLNWAVATIPCPAGTVGIGGSAEVPHDFWAMMLDSHPSPVGWEVSVGNADTSPRNVTFTAVCARPAPGTPVVANTSSRRFSVTVGSLHR